MDFTQDQIDKLNSLGVTVQPEKLEIKNLDIRNSKLEIKHPKSNVFPLLSISGLTILSFSGLILLKGNSSKTSYGQTDVSAPNLPSNSSPSPTQVPKSIQHYLLTSQQYFSKALQQQSSCTGDSCGRPDTIELLNNSILAATQAIKEFPQDYRGYQQRGKIYQALIDSQPKLIDQSISDLASALKLNSSSAEITHTLASLYAKKGDAQKTILYLSQTVALEPTKAQNFYDLAKIQQQAGLLPQALETYTKLITLVTDSNQKTQVESEKSALEKLISQNPNQSSYGQTDVSAPPTIDLPLTIESPTIQASAGAGLIVAAPEEGNKIEVKNQSDSNSFSGNSILLSNQKEIIINNTQITDSSQVYVTIIKGGKNQNLQIISKSSGSFTVGLDTPLSEDVEFKWWIIN